LKNILSRPRTAPNGECWTIASTPGVRPAEPQLLGLLAFVLLGFRQHRERRVLEVVYALEIQRDDLRLRLGDRVGHHDRAQRAHLLHGRVAIMAGAPGARWSQASEDRQTSGGFVHRLDVRRAVENQR
jgi:hypothetical protein